MIGFPREQGNLLLAAFLIGDIARDLRGPDNLAGAVEDGRDGQGDIDHLAVLALAHGFEMVGALAAADALKDTRLLVMSVGGNDGRDRLADDLFREVPEQPFRALVPGGDHTIEVLADDRVVRRFNDRDQSPLHAFSARVLAYVDQHVHRADEGAGGIVKGRGKRHERNAGAVGPLGDRLGPPDRPLLPATPEPWALVVRQRRPVGLVEPPRAAPLVAVERGRQPRRAAAASV